MKLKSFKILSLGVSLLFFASSCVKMDTYTGPDASLTGNVIEDGSKNNVQTCSGNFSIRLEQLSWDSTPAPQDIPVKYDGSYQNTKIFSGHYRVSIHGGAFWPVAPEEMDISSGTVHDFKLTPYLTISDFNAEMTDSTTLRLTYSLDAPVAGIPKILEVQPYLNTTQIVGPGASIYDFSDLNKIAVNKDWADFNDADKNGEIIVSNLIPGRIFYVRVGVKFDNNDKSSNLSNVIKITVPGK
ncbi:DUF3823 domain-containing protein [Pinibacter aurantiacus]|uniref:DUF3823 domain-containing protein n=1 Tax=Pinibacter aurantiacus TaxID=2851599 RepID=A0A9E2SCA9_9BACT|nr:DUF3823 domain-containing protein [Pinibacter aurantiacus]MBV4360458.1 DUF3823 domain-containing protein [Pinibacter aurantiacus]